VGRTWQVLSAGARTIADGEYSLEGPARSGPALIILDHLVLTLEPGTNFPSSFSTLPGKETNNFLADGHSSMLRRVRI
jgi:hypothetical protein